jgi:hypothetical protein
VELAVNISVGFYGRIENMGFVPAHALQLWNSSHSDLSSCIGRYFERTRLLEEMCYVDKLNEFMFLESVDPFSG